MPVLDWIGKKAVANHHREVPYRLLHCDKSKSAGNGDNLDKLSNRGEHIESRSRQQRFSKNQSRRARPGGCGQFPRFRGGSATFV